MAIDRDLRIEVQVSGIGQGIMFDRYSGSNTTTLTTEEKMYFMPNSREVCLPSSNIMSFLSAQNTPSAPKRLFDSRQYKKIANALASYVFIEEDRIPFKRGGETIVFRGFNNSGEDTTSHIVKHSAVARLEKGIPNPKERPLILNEPEPWQLQFHLRVLKNEDISIDDMKRIFRLGGMAVAFGTYRPHFGKFNLDRFEIEQLGE